MNLKTFSQQSRRILIKGVAQKLLYWGFDAKGNELEQPMPLEGGYLFRGEGFDDPSVPQKWSALKDAVDKKGIETVVEEAAYTWFNRIIAIRILSKNKYDQSQLEFEGDSTTPTILVRARRGQVDFLNSQEKQRLQKVITNYNKEKESFGILLTGYCGQHQLLKSIFGRLDDYTELLLPDDILEKDGFVHLLNTTDAISDEDYQKVELIGWLYQFYISERKDEVFASFKKNKKAEAKDIPAATQIFTPNWIVKYMVQNTVGKLWLDLNPDSRIKDEMKYLIADEAQKQDPIISEVANLKLLDPAVGSGHILVEGFDLLYAMYMEEFYTPEEAVESILKNNLFGLDIDNRAAQLAKFAVLLKAAKRYPEVLQKGWMPQVYAMPEPVFFNRQDILDFLGKDGLEYENALESELIIMRDAQNLGSTMFTNITAEERTFFHKRLQELKNQEFKDINTEFLLNRIEPYINVVIILSDLYEAVAANPPYMGSGNMNASLKEYLVNNYPESKSDLFATFMEVCNYRNVENGLTGMINQHSWMFLSSYEKLRDTTLANFGILNMLHLGPRTFEELSGEVVQSTAFVIQNGKAIQKGNYVRLVDFRPNIEKEKEFLTGNHRYLQIPQTNFAKIPGSPITYWVSQNFVKSFQFPALIDQYEVKSGIMTGNDSDFIKYWFEVSWGNIGFKLTHNSDFDNHFENWYPLNKGDGIKKWYPDYQYVLKFKNSGEELKKLKGKQNFRVRDSKYYFQPGINWSDVGSNIPSFRFQEPGLLFAARAPMIFSSSYYLLGLLNSKVIMEIIKAYNPTLTININDIERIPLKDLATKELQLVIQNNVSNNIVITKNIDKIIEGSWDFEQSPLLNDSSNLKSAYLFWQRHVSDYFFSLHRNEEELNRIFIEIYGLQEELNPEVPLTEITILQEELDFKKLEKQEAGLRKKGIGIKAKDNDLPLIPEGYALPIKKGIVIKQLISYAIGVNMGRYRLDKPGLNIAHPDPAEGELASYVHNGFTVEIDEDGIIPLMGTACTFADDAFQRVKFFLEVVWGSETLTQNLNFLQECLDEDLESYLVKKFWADHCKKYKKKPIYWLFSSEKGAFQVMTYMHRMNAFTVEKIRSNYLMPHLQHLRSQIDRLESSREDPRLLDKLHKNLSECESYDLKLKDVADRQIVFDLDDGVTRNYALFDGVVRKVK